MEEMSHIPIEPADQKPKTSANWSTPIAIIIAGLLIAGAVIYKNGQPAPTASDRPVVNFEAMDAIDPKIDHLRGNSSASITIVEYSDLECPFCKVFHQTMLDIYSTYGKTNKVAWVYRHFPLSMHPKARDEARAAECASKLGGNNEAFWKYIDQVFLITPSNNGLDLAMLPEIAKNNGLNEAAFKNCTADKTMMQKIDKDFANGNKIGVSGTPFVVMVNNSTGDKIELFDEEIPSDWPAEAKNIKADALRLWGENINKLRAGN